MKNEVKALFFRFEKNKTGKFKWYVLLRENCFYNTVYY